MNRPVIVGIMSYRSRAGARPFSEGGYFKSLIRAARSISVRAYVFCPLDIDWVGRRIYGYTFNQSTGGWVSKYFPFPDVVYDRLFPPRGRMANILFAAARRLRGQRNVVFFGRALRGKWEVYRSLMKYPELKPHVPDTKPLRGVGTLAQMLKTHRYVFVKPDMGSQGKGVVQVRVTSDGFLCRGRDYLNRPFETKVHSVAGVLNLVRNVSHRRKLLVQQGLHLNHFKGRTFDIRTVVQKNEQGKWVITGTAARVGRPGSVTSNLHGGGRALCTEALIKAEFPEKHEEIISTINTLGVKMPEALDRELGRFGELGLDLGVDKDGKVWLIEANSKPGRTVFLRIRAIDLRRASIMRPMQYCKYLALQKRNRGEEQCAT